ncbi:uncharacterized protein LOC143851527 [Tasmannia lanceolata]|uniref:uncharacterized protein LOC143851527 n=1 Tax=Tasmannia lanceolata TaxID=3420 RepID=UPI0040644E67
MTVSLNAYNSFGPKPFKFMNMWLQDNSLYSTVEMAWAVKVSGNPMFSFTQKLKEVKKHLKDWNEGIFGRIDIETPIIKNSLKKVQNSLTLDPANRNLINEENSLRSKLIEYSMKEEFLLKQKSRIQWLNHGDSNSKFFHTAVKSRINSNSILATRMDDGSITEDHAEISNLFVNYFHRVLNNGKVQLRETPNPIRKLSTEDSISLTREVTAEEIRDAVFKASRDKAPGPDGFTARFFQSFWYLIDDLMVFLKGDITSTKGILKCLSRFSKISGLEANLEKSEIFFSGLHSRTKQNILQLMNIKEGSFPIKYLGLPPVTSRLSIRDCSSLVSKIQAKISSWSSRHLSQAGRVEH